VRVGEPAACAREGVEMRRLDQRGAVTAEIAVTDVIGEDENDVGFLRQAEFTSFGGVRPGSGRE